MDLFKPVTEDDVMAAEVIALKESHHAVRKKSFAMINELTKIMLRQQEELDYIKVKMGLTCIVDRKNDS
jgi:hypothetical protein